MLKLNKSICLLCVFWGKYIMTILMIKFIQFLISCKYSH